ncbi:hypothetical protein OG921_21430 [Aldersonia sp. NBC_00410]|nr:hypothetical protein [Aldersonia sp. NBC_00410]MCX5045732.1 hypothetical protein [Aldersonia sp. NBC_00410]
MSNEMKGRLNERSNLSVALDAGGTLLDTGDFYGAWHNEQLIARA